MKLTAVEVDVVFSAQQHAGEAAGSRAWHPMV